MKLAQDQPVPKFLATCLDCSLHSEQSMLPKNTTQDIFDYFEVPNPYKERAAQPSALGLLLSPRKAMLKRKRLEPKEEQPKQQPPSKPPVVHAALPSSVRLTAPVSKKNSLLARDGLLSRSRFVGSHFNTNLSNMNSLFRQVKMPTAPPKNSLVKQIALSKPTRASTRQPLYRSPKAANVRFDPGLRPSSSLARTAVAAVPETPQGKAKRVVQETPEPPKQRSAITRLGVVSTRESVAGASLVAQAFRSVQQRQRRR